MCYDKLNKDYVFHYNYNIDHVIVLSKEPVKIIVSLVK
jgi:hypothetical protein